jgi:ATP-binding cassette subfamily B protein
MTGAVEFSILQQKKSDQRGPVRWIFSHGIRQWPLILVAMVGAFGNAALAAAAAVLLGQAFNAVSAAPMNTPLLIQTAWLITAAAVGRGLLQLARNFGFEFMAQRVERDVRRELYTSLLGKSMTFHSLQSVGDTMARATNDVREVNFLFSPGLNLVLGSLNFLIMPLIVAPRYHPALLLSPALFIAAYFWALRGYLRTLTPITNEVRASFGSLNSRLSEALDGVETVKGAAQEEAEVDRFGKNARRYRDAAVRQGNVEARFLPMILFVVALAVGLLHALYLFRAGLLNTGQVVAYYSTLLLLDFPTWTSMWAYSQISLGLAGGRRILDLINRENSLDQNLAGHAGGMRGEITFEDACFRYDANDEHTSLKHLTFTVKQGQTVAIVGQTGSGKTTLAKLINRTYDVDCGNVRVDGVDVREWNLETLRRGISIIEQDVFLFSRSIADNIAFGKPGATREEIVAAAVAAQADDFIQGFDQGYETVIGERGVTLSGGQRQRLALARAFLTDPRILILDDSTSAIDSATEDKIQRAIYAAARGRTTLIITHRLSQIRWADLIVVLRKGEIAAIGTHEDLMKSSESYRRIFSST